MAHPGAEPLPGASVAPDPGCPTCRGTGAFVPDWKPTEVPLSCPRCVAPGAVRPVRENWRGIPGDTIGAI